MVTILATLGADMLLLKTTTLRFTLFAAFASVALPLFAMSLRGSLTRPFIFPAPDYRFTPALPGGKLVTAHGERTAYGYYARGGKRLVVFFHGNGEVMGSMQDLAAMMLAKGMSVLLAEYPGYGYAAAYTPSENNLYTDAELLIESVQQEYQHTRKDTVLWGFSLGTGIAVEMAARGLGSSLVLMAPFTSMVELAERHFTALARFMVVDRFDNAAKAAKITVPVLIIHGNHDRIIPVEQAKRLAQIFPQARYIEIDGADHNDLMARTPQEIWRAIIKFALGN